MSRNVVIDRNGPPYPGALTFNAEVADDYEGRIFIFATVRLGDHAHVDCYSGRQNARRDGDWLLTPTRHFGHAGRLVFAWRDWLLLPRTARCDADVLGPRGREPDAGPVGHPRMSACALNQERQRG